MIKDKEKNKHKNRQKQEKTQHIQHNNSQLYIHGNV